MPWGSSATWTGERREFEEGEAFWRVEEMDSRELGLGSRGRGGRGVDCCFRRWIGRDDWDDGGF